VARPPTSRLMNLNRFSLLNLSSRIQKQLNLLNQSNPPNLQHLGQHLRFKKPKVL
jgi:hypothetical protein